MTIKTKLDTIIDRLEPKDKVDLLKKLYKDIAGMGVGGDTELAHINSFEASVLRSLGGAGTLNIKTGLPQYVGGGGGAPQAVYQNVQQSSRIPEEVAPFAEDIMTEAQDRYRMMLEKGYDPYTGATIAPLTDEQQAAMAGISGLVGTGEPLMEEALDIYRTTDDKFTPEIAAEYMSPYQRAVVEEEKDRAIEDFYSKVMPDFEKQMISAGGLSGLGSRAGVEAATLREGLADRLGGIEKRGLQEAYKDAMSLFKDQKSRETAAAQAIGQMGPAMFSQMLAEQGALQTVGEQKQDLGQQVLDKDYYQWMEQQAYPEEELAKYAGFVYGNPLMSQRDVSTEYSAPGAQGPSWGQQALAAGMMGANIYRQAGSPSFGGIFRAGGGGLSDLPVVNRRRSGGVYQPVLIDGKYYDKRDLIENPIEDEVTLMEEREKVRREDPVTYYGGSYPTEEEMVKEVIKERVGDNRGIIPESAAPLAADIDITEKIVENRRPSMKDKLSKYFDPEERRKTARQQQQESDTLFDKFQRLRDKQRAESRTRRERSAELDRARRMEAIGEDDPLGTYLNAIAASLLKTRSGDPRDPDSAVSSTLQKVLEGVGKGGETLSKSEKARREKLLKLEEDMSKREREDIEREVREKEADLTRNEDRQLKVLARKFDLEKEIAKLPLEEKKLALEILQGETNIDKARAQIKKLVAEAKYYGRRDTDTSLKPNEINALGRGFEAAYKKLYGKDTVGYSEAMSSPTLGPVIAALQSRARKVAESKNLTTAINSFEQMLNRYNKANPEQKKQLEADLGIVVEETQPTGRKRK